MTLLSCAQLRDHVVNGEEQARLVDLADAVVAWRDSTCAYQWPARSTKYGECCVGDNHLEACPCEVARQNVLATSQRFQR